MWQLWLTMLCARTLGGVDACRNRGLLKMCRGVTWLMCAEVFGEGWRAVGSIILWNLACFSARGGGGCWFRACFLFYRKVSQGVCSHHCTDTFFCIVRHCPSQKRQEGGICACWCTVNPRESLYIAWGLTLISLSLPLSCSLLFFLFLSLFLSPVSSLWFLSQNHTAMDVIEPKSLPCCGDVEYQSIYCTYLHDCPLVTGVWGPGQLWWKKNRMEVIS